MTHGIISLNGTWLIRADPGNVGLAQEWHRQPAVFLSERAAERIDVPRAWQHVLGDSYHYLAWYRKVWIVPDDWSPSRTRIRFEAVATEIDVWVNAEHIGHHCGDYVPFEFDLSRHVRPGGALDIVARVDEKLGHLTKGFHDMVSIHHGGIWGDVSVRGSGSVFARPNGIFARANATSGEIHVGAELAATSESRGRMRITVADPRGKECAASEIKASDRNAFARGITIPIDHPHLWSPDDPALYRVHVALLDDDGGTDEHDLAIGFRSVIARDRHILFNGLPLHLRGILHWGHEPGHLAPAAPPQQVHDEFAHLRALGFNCICLCMWYPPPHYYDIADEVGMLIWQEHPVWHSPMSPELNPEYQRLYDEFFRRDRNHPSVSIVSATCEHPTFDRALAQWWWRRAREVLPDKLLQVQTSSFAWSNADETNLYDEHTYENNDRWPRYLADVQEKLCELPVKPFVMGESVLFTSWPDLQGIESQRAQSIEWSRPRWAEDGGAFERAIADRYGADTLERFKRHADRYHLLGRKFQVEAFRRYSNHAGLVQNQLRDVPNCTCGFMDALGRWRFTPAETRSWLNDVVLILKTPDERRAFQSGERIDLEIIISNFRRHAICDALEVDVRDFDFRQRFAVECACGETKVTSFNMTFAQVDRPQRLTLSATIVDCSKNSWDLWVIPEISHSRSGLYRLDGLPFSADERGPDAIERGYSRGFGLPVKSWSPHLPHLASLAPSAKLWRPDDPIPPDARIIMTHRLTKSLVEDISQGGRVLLFASKARGALGARFEWLFGGCTLIIETPPLAPGDSEWIVDLLGFDLTHRSARVIPTDELGWRDRVQPLVRFVYTHDQRRITCFDQLFATRIGDGLLVVSALDHYNPAGRYLLHRILAWTANDDAVEGIASSLEASELAAHAI